MPTGYSADATFDTLAVSSVSADTVFGTLASVGETPLIFVEIAFATNPTEAPVWADVTPFVEALSARRGRQGPLESAGAGTGSARLNNADRRFDPLFSEGPYYGQLKPMRRLRFSAVQAARVTPFFAAYVDGFPQSRENYGHQFTDLKLSDAFKIFSLSTVSGTFPQQTSDARIADVLTAIGWLTGQGWLLGDPVYGVLASTTALGPVGDRALDRGNSQVQEATLANASALSHLQAVEQSENGFLFVGKDGAVTFRNRQRRLVAGTSPNAAVFGDDLAAGELPYVEVAFDYSDQEIANEVRVTTEGGVEQVASDAQSKAEYFPRTLSRSLLVPTDGEAKSVANYLLSRYKQPTPRITTLQLDGEEPTGAVWPQLLERELGDRVTVRATPLGGGTRVEQVSFIEGLAVDWNAAGNRWAWNWQLSQADTTSYWQLNQSALGVNTALAY